MDEIEEAWSESRIDKPKKYPMPLWLTDEDFEYIVTTLWKCRKSEKKCNDLYERLNTILQGAKTT